jgi:hypothetical protein
MQAYHQYGVGSRRFVNYRKGYTRLTSASDKPYQLLAHGCWVPPGTLPPWYSWNIAESGVKHNKSINRSINQLKWYFHFS